MATVAIGLGVSLGLNLLGRALTPNQKTFNRQEVGRPDNLSVRRTGQGWSLDRIYGKYKVQGCPIFWALEKVNVQEVTTTSESTGGKGGGGTTTTTETTTNKKFGTFAFAVCDGPISEIRRIEFNDIVVYNASSEDPVTNDANVYMLDNYLEIYLGTSNQLASPTISSYSDPERVKFPYLCYIVVKDYPLEQFGDELPSTINVTLYGTEDNAYTVLLDIAQRCGLASVDIVPDALSALPISGRLKQDGSSAKNFIEELIQRYFAVSYLGDNGEIIFEKQENTDTPIEIDYEDLGIINFGDSPSEPFSENILDPQELPSQVTLNYTNINDAYNGGSSTWVRPASVNFRAESLSSNLALTPDQATEFCWRYLRQVWDQDRDFSFKLLPEKQILIKPRDLINVPLNPVDNPITFQVTEIQTGADFSAEIKAIPYNGESFSAVPSIPKTVTVTVEGSTVQLSPNLTGDPVITSGETTYEEGVDYTVDPVTGEITIITIPVGTEITIDYESEPDYTEDDSDPNAELPFYGEPIVTIIDTHRVNDSDPPSLYFALEPDPLYGTVGTTAFYGRLNNSSYVLIGSAQSATTIGTLNTLFPLTTGLDTTTTISITLDRGLLDPLTNEEFADDQLILLVEDEHISVKNAVLTSELTYDVSHFRRGHNGTIPVSHPIGSRVTVLNGKGKTIRINGSASNIGSVLDVKAIPQGQSLDTIVAVYSATIEGLYFKPYTPSNATATINQSSNISISFTANDTGLNPLDPQSFEIEVYDGLTLVRTIASDSTTIRYLSSEQITDFGIVQSSLDLVIYQLSSEYGRGYPLTVTVVPTPVVELPTIITFSPLQGDIGAAISIYGEGFTGATSAAINGIDLTSFAVANDTTITGIIGTGTTTGKVSVTNSAGTTESIGDFVIYTPSVEWGDITGNGGDNPPLEYELLKQFWVKS